MNKPEISIITPVYNGMPYLEECIRSVLSQPVQNWEMLISDDGSNDGSRAFLDSIEDPRIKVFKQEKNKGIFGNLNFLMNHINGPLVQILCQDDYLLENGLAGILESWKFADAGTSFIRHNWFDYSSPVDKDEKKYFSAKVLNHKQTAQDTPFVFFLFGNPAGNLSNVSFQPKYYFKGVRFKEDLPYAGDYEYWGRLGLCGPWQINPKKVSYIRVHEQQASNYLNFKGELISQQRQVKEEFYKQICQRYPKHLLKLRGSWNYFRFLNQAIRVRNYSTTKQVIQNLRSSGHAAPYLTILLFLVSFGGLLFKDTSAKLLLKRNSNVLMPQKSKPL